MTLDAPSDRGGRGGGEAFPCGGVVDVPGPTESCAFSGEAAVTVTLGAGASVVPGDAIALVAGAVGPALPLCAGAGPAEATTALLAAPDPAVAPRVVLVAPLEAGSCGDLELDASQTAGGGGRPLAFAWSATGALGAKAAAATGATLVVAAADLAAAAGTTVDVEVAATNFLGETSAATASVRVRDEAIPTVAISGGARRELRRSEPLEVFASAEACAAAGLDSAALDYAWAWDRAGWPASRSLNPRSFSLEAYDAPADAPGSSATLAVTVTDASGVAARASIELAFVRSDVVAVVAGGDRVAAAAATVLLDASASGDPDADGGGGVDVAWRCDVGGAPCAFDVAPGPVAELNGLAPGVYAFAATATAPDGRSATSAPVAVNVVADPAPCVAVDAVAGGDRLNAESGVTVTARVDPCGGGPVDWSWAAPGAVFDGAPDLAAAAAVATRGAAAAPGDVVLKLGAGVLVPGGAYALELSARFADGSGAAASSTVALAVNAPPSGGSVAVAPAAGEALATAFAILAEGWVDAAGDGPLRYAYAYRAPAAGARPNVLATDLLEPELRDVVLPQGDELDGYGVVVAVRCRDAHGAAASRETTIVVEPSAMGAAELGAYAEGRLAAALETTNTEAAHESILGVALTLAAGDRARRRRRRLDDAGCAHGVAAGDACACDAGWHGPACDVDADDWAATTALTAALLGGFEATMETQTPNGAASLQQSSTLAALGSDAVDSLDADGREGALSAARTVSVVAENTLGDGEAASGATSRNVVGTLSSLIGAGVFPPANATANGTSPRAAAARARQRALATRVRRKAKPRARRRRLAGAGDAAGGGGGAYGDLVDAVDAVALGGLGGKVRGEAPTEVASAEVSVASGVVEGSLAAPRRPGAAGAAGVDLGGGEPVEATLAELNVELHGARLSTPTVRFEVMGSAGDGDFFVVLPHEPHLDLDAAAAALIRADCGNASDVAAAQAAADAACGAGANVTALCADAKLAADDDYAFDDDAFLAQLAAATAGAVEVNCSSAATARCDRDAASSRRSCDVAAVTAENTTCRCAAALAEEPAAVWKSNSELGYPNQTSELSISVKSKSIWLIFGRIDCSRQFLEAQQKALRRDGRMSAH